MERSAGSLLCQLLNALWEVRDGLASDECVIFVLRSSTLPTGHATAARPNTHHCWRDNVTQVPAMYCWEGVTPIARRTKSKMCVCLWNRSYYTHFHPPPEHKGSLRIEVLALCVVRGRLAFVLSQGPRTADQWAP